MQRLIGDLIKTQTELHAAAREEAESEEQLHETLDNPKPRLGSKHISNSISAPGPAPAQAPSAVLGATPRATVASGAKQALERHEMLSRRLKSDAGI
jgi:hypothetical protein